MKYDFRCEEHGVFEINQRITETTKTTACPTCGAECPKHIGVVNFICPPAAGYKPFKIKDPTKTDWVKEEQKKRWE